MSLTTLVIVTVIVVVVIIMMMSVSTIVIRRHHVPPVAAPRQCVAARVSVSNGTIAVRVAVPKCPGAVPMAERAPVASASTTAVK